MKTITKAELISMGACKEVLDRFIDQTNNTDKPVLISSLLNGKNKVSDLIWLAGRTCSIVKIQKFARDIALINIELTKPYCRDADYELILNFLKTGENADAAAARATRVIYTIAARATDATTDVTYAADATLAAAHAAAARTTYAATYAATHTTYTIAAASADTNTDIDLTPHLEELFN